MADRKVKSSKHYAGSTSQCSRTIGSKFWESPACMVPRTNWFVTYEFISLEETSNEAKVT